MGLFGFGKDKAASKRENALIIHAGSDSVVGAYITYGGDESSVWYSARAAIEKRGEESLADASERALRSLAEPLTREGVPALVRGSGSGHCARISAYLGAPWEETKVRVEAIDLGREFTVSSATRARALAHEVARDPSRRPAGESIMTTLLNGYETGSPIGKRARRAEFIIRSSSLDEEAAKSVERALRSSLQAHAVDLNAFMPVACEAIRRLFPHEESYFVVDAGSAATAVALVHRHALADMRSASVGASDLAAWRTSTIELLRTAAGEHAAPQTIFLITDERIREDVKTALSDPATHMLWPGIEELRVVPLTPQNITGVHVQDSYAPDIHIALLARAG